MVYEKGYQKICDWTDAHAEEMAADLQRIARVKSVSRADLAEDGLPAAPDLDYDLERADTGRQQLLERWQELTEEGTP